MSNFHTLLGMSYDIRSDILWHPSFWVGHILQCPTFWVGHTRSGCDIRRPSGQIQGDPKWLTLTSYLLGISYESSEMEYCSELPSGQVIVYQENHTLESYILGRLTHTTFCVGDRKSDVIPGLSTEPPTCMNNFLTIS